MQNPFRFKKSRKYPIKRDDRGQSLRARCFELFDEGIRPVEAASELKMEESTAKRYFQQWKKQSPNFEKRYAYAKELSKPSSPDRERTSDLIAHLDIGLQLQRQ